MVASLMSKYVKCNNLRVGGGGVGVACSSPVEIL